MAMWYRNDPVLRKTFPALAALLVLIRQEGAGTSFKISLNWSMRCVRLSMSICIAKTSKHEITNKAIRMFFLDWILSAIDDV